MIGINLLPDEFKRKAKEESRFPYKKIAIAAGACFLLVTVYLYIDYLVIRERYAGIQLQWEHVKPRYNELSNLQKEVTGPIRDKKEFMQRFLTTQWPLTNILVWLSQELPETAWLTSVKLDRQGKKEYLILRGLSLPSKEKSSIEQIELYLNHIKSKFPNPELSLTTTRQTLHEVVLTQFVAQFAWSADKP